MTIAIPGWRITSDKYSYKVQRQLAKGRWVTEGYHPDIGLACESLFKQRVQTETTKETISICGECSAGASTVQQLIKTIEGIADELREGVKNEIRN